MTSTMNSYYFVSSTDGALHDTRSDNWSGNPLRSNYAWTHSSIETVADLKATLRAGAYAWPGGYPMYFLTSDGAALSFETVRSEFANVAWSIRENVSDGWKVMGCDINYEDDDLFDDHTGERIECAYSAS